VITASATGGRVSLVTGLSHETTSGSMLLQTANSGKDGASGLMTLSTGTSKGDVSGSIYVGTGDSNGGVSGSVFVGVGTSSTNNGGDVSVDAGETTHASSVGGNVDLRAGSGATDGRVRLYSDLGASDPHFAVHTTGVFIGTSSAKVPKLDVYATNAITLSGASALIDTSGSISVESDTSIAFTGGTSTTFAKMTLSDNGLVVTDGNSKLTLSQGGLYVTNGVTIHGGLAVHGGIKAVDVGITASDRRLKTDIVRLDNSLEKVSKLRGVYYKWVQDDRTGHTFDSKRHVGVIAQEVRSVLPEVVDSIYDGNFLGVDYPALIPLLIEAIRELDERTKVNTTGSLYMEKIVKLESSNKVLLNELSSLRKSHLNLSEDIEELKLIVRALL